MAQGFKGLPLPENDVDVSSLHVCTVADHFSAPWEEE